MNSTKKIACQNLTISYNRHPVIHHLDAEFKIGTTNAIIGPNGAGKSTLLKALLGELKIDGGKIIIEGINKSDIAYLPQVNEIDTSLPFTVEDVVLLGLLFETKLNKGINQLNDNKIDNALYQVGLHGYRTRYINELSRGQLQRVFLARMIIQKASVIILDEPFNAMDSKTTSDLLHLIKNWQQNKITIIAVLHDLHQVAKNFEYTFLIAQELIAYGKTKEVLTRKNLEVAYKNSFLWLNQEELCENN